MFVHSYFNLMVILLTFGNIVQEIQHAKYIRENGIPYMELMSRIFGRQGSRPEAMYSTNMQDANNANEDERGPVDDIGDDSNVISFNDSQLQSQNISVETPSLSSIGPSKRLTKRQPRVAPYENNRGKEVSQSQKINVPRRRNAFESEINGHFKEMMEFRRVQVDAAKERREKSEGHPYKEAYNLLQSIQGLEKWTNFWWACIKVLKEDPFAREMMACNEDDQDRIIFLEGYTGYDRQGNFIGDRFNTLQSCNYGVSPRVNVEQNITKPNMESHRELETPSHTELMSLFRQIGYECQTKKVDDGGESSQTKPFNLED